MYKLLICEDELLERKALHLLIQRNYQNIQIVGDASNGLDAIKMAHQYLPDIILMDISMPRCNGLDAQKEILRFLPNIKTIIITAYNDFNYAQQAIKNNVADYLLKPVSPQALYTCLDQVIKECKTAPRTLAPEYTDNIQKILDYIDSHVLDDLKLKHIADQFNLSEKYLSRYFKQKTGVSYTEYITNLKIERAKHYLRYSDAPIYEISMELNFSDASYFTKVFQKREGISPSNYRQKYNS